MINNRDAFVEPKSEERLGCRRLLVPCLVGDVLWCLVGSDCSVVAPMTVENLYINKLGVVVGLSGNGKYMEIFGEEIGKLAFWSEEAAVEARDECLAVVDDLLGKAVEKAEEYSKGYMDGLLESLDNRPSGLLEEF